MKVMMGDNDGRQWWTQSMIMNIIKSNHVNDDCDRYDIESKFLSPKLICISPLFWHTFCHWNSFPHTIHSLVKRSHPFDVRSSSFVIDRKKKIVQTHLGILNWKKSKTTPRVWTLIIVHLSNQSNWIFRIYIRPDTVKRVLRRKARGHVYR